MLPLSFVINLKTLFGTSGFGFQRYAHPFEGNFAQQLPALHLMSSRPEHLSSLTALRGIAALMVVVYHFSKIVLDGNLLTVSQSSLVRKSYLMVDFFFMLSGFIMVYVYGDHFLKKYDRGKVFGQFMVARLARLYPLHLFTLAWCILLKVLLHFSGVMASLSPKLQSMFDAKAIPIHLLLLNAYIPDASLTFNIPSWSISAEWYTYMIFPALVWIILQKVWLRKLAYVVLLFGLYGGIVHYFGDGIDLNVTNFGGALRCFAGFCLGMITCTAYLELRQWHWMIHSGWFVVAGMIALSAMHLGANDLYILSLFPFLIFLAARNTGALSRLFNRPVFQAVGEWSYSIYMIHVPLISTALAGWLMCRTTVPSGTDNAAALALSPLVSWAACSLYLVLVVALATLTFRFVEKPMRILVNTSLGARSVQVVGKERA